METTLKQIKEKIIKLKKEGKTIKEICKMPNLLKDWAKVSKETNEWYAKSSLKQIIKETLIDSKLVEFNDLYDLEDIDRLRNYIDNNGFKYENLLYVVENSECILIFKDRQELFEELVQKINISPARWAYILKKGEEQDSLVYEDFSESNDGTEREIHINQILIEYLLKVNKEVLTSKLLEVISLYILKNKEFFDQYNDYLLGEVVKNSKVSSKILSIIYNDLKIDYRCWMLLKKIVRHSKTEINLLLDIILNGDLEFKKDAICNKNCPANILVLGIYEILKDEDRNLNSLATKLKVNNPNATKEILSLLSIF